MKSDFYVYIHRKKTNNEIYYVGKGTKRRAWDFHHKQRNNLWNKIHNKYGTNVEIVLDSLTEEQAFSLEKDLIEFYGKRSDNAGPLANITNGGEGCVGAISGENHPFYDNRVWTFYNVDTEEIVKTTRYYFGKDHPNVVVDLILNRGRSSKRWVVLELFSNDKIEAIRCRHSGKHSKVRLDKVLFVNIDTLEEKLEYPVEMSKFIGNKIHEIISGKNLKCKGWTTSTLIEKYGIDKIRMAGKESGLNSQFSDKTIYQFINPRLELREECTRIELQERYNVDVCPLFSNTKKLTSIRGWMLYSEYLKGKRPLKDLNIYIFENEELGAILECSRQDFKKLTGVSCKRLFHEKPYKTVAGWKLIKD